MVLTLLDLAAIVCSVVVTFILLLIFLATYTYLKERYQKPRKLKVKSLVADLTRQIEMLNERIGDRAYIDSDLKNELRRAAYETEWDILSGLEPSGYMTLDVAEDGANKVQKLIKDIEEAVEEQLVADIKIDVIEEEPPKENIIAVQLEIEFTKKYESGGCAFLDEFDSADFVVLSDVSFELTRDMVDRALNKWCFDASLQSFKKEDGKWYGYVGFVDADAPEEGTKLNLQLEINESLVNCEG